MDFTFIFYYMFIYIICILIIFGIQCLFDQNISMIIAEFVFHFKSNFNKIIE